MTVDRRKLSKIRIAVQRAWSKETSFDPEHWNNSNPAWGQCAVTSMVLRDYLGGKLKKKKIAGTSHYWNQLPDGSEIDLTLCQFTRQKIDFRSTTASIARTFHQTGVRKRYLILKKETERVLAKIDLLEEKILNCKACEAVEHFPTPPIQWGNARGLFIIGESPSAKGWRKSGRAFYDVRGKLIPSGKNLVELLGLLGLSLDDVTFTEAAKCYIHDKSKLRACIKNCSHFLCEEIDIVRPMLIVSLGERATEAIKDYSREDKIRSIPFRNLRGRFFTVEIGGLEYRVYPISHVSSVNPNNHRVNKVLIRRLARILRKRGELEQLKS